MLLPVVIRELSVRSRLTSTFYVRAAAAGAVTLIVGLALLVAAMSRRMGGGPIGAELMGLIILLLVYVLVEGLRMAAGGISQERREGTLGFLFLTDLSSLDVLLGKLSGAAVTTLYTLLATLPITGLAILFGGVTGGQFFRCILALLSALAVSLACGAWASVRCRDGMVAIATATALLMGATALPLALDAGWQARTGTFHMTDATVALFSPIAGITLADDVSQRVDAARYWWSLAAQLALAGLLVADAARRLRGIWRRDESASHTAPKRRRSGKVRTDFGEVIAQTLAARIHLGRWLAGLVLLTCLGHFSAVLQWVSLNITTSGGIALSSTSVLAGMAGLARLLLFAYLATRVFADARHSGEMEILLTTRLGDGELVRLLWRAMRRVVFWLAGLDVLFSVLGMAHTLMTLSATVPPGTRQTIVLSTLGENLSNVLDWVAFTWSAMWYGISSRRTEIALVKTFGSEIAIAVGASIGGGLAALLLVRFAASASMVVVAQLSFLPTIFLQLGLNGWRLRWAKSLLTTRFRQAAAGLGP